MPYVSVHTNIRVSKEKEQSLIKVLGKGIEVITNKTEENLFIKIEDNQRLYKGGDINTPNAMISVDLFGHSTSEDLQKYCDVLNSALLSELGINSDKIYINFTECRHWGAGGNLNTAFEI